MRERLVRFRHLVRIFALLDGVAAVVGGVENLARQLVRHLLLAAVARERHEPADGQRAGAEQQLFTLRGGDGLLLTTIKWASGNGKAFLGEDRAKSGVTPSVEVKRPELADAVDPDDLTGNDDDNVTKPDQPAEKREAAPQPGVTHPPVEDVQMKKALELLRENKPAATQRAA